MAEAGVVEVGLHECKIVSTFSGREPASELGFRDVEAAMRQFLAVTDENAFDPRVVRTHVSDELVWSVVLDQLRRPWGDGFRSDVVIVEGPDWLNANPEVVVEAGRISRSLNVVFIADEFTIRSPHHPLLAATCITREDYADFPEEYEAELEFGPWFRTVPTEVQAIHVNLALSNMTFSDFSYAAHQEPDQIFHGFSG